MTEEAKAARREYYRKYREEHRERLQEQARAYREAHREEARAASRAWRAANADRVKEYNADYWQRKATGQAGTDHDADN